MEKIQLTTNEVDLLITIMAIMEFEDENPGNIPYGGVGEIIVSSNIMESDTFQEMSESLYDYGLLNDEDFLTEAGQSYLNQLEEDLKRLKEDKDAECINDYSKIDFVKVKDYIKEKLEKVDWNKVNCICSILLVIEAYLIK